MNEIPLNWWNANIGGKQNVGDLLSKYVVEKLTKKEVYYVNKWGLDKLVAVGSLIDYHNLYSKSYIWGTGTMRSSPISFQDKRENWLNYLFKRQSMRSKICALRGPVTGKIIERLGFEDPEVYGDPALLLPNYFSPEIKEKRFSVGLILHWSQEVKLNLVEKENLLQSGIKLISILRSTNEEIEEFIEEIASCEMIFSTSLHGLIVSQAYKIPTKWCRLAQSEIHPEASLKFKDYFLGTNQEIMEPIDLSLEVESLKKLRSINNIGKVNYLSSWNPKKLIESFPKEYLNEKEPC